MDTGYNRQIFAKNLKNIMDKNGIMAVDIAQKLGVTKSTVSHWLHGTKVPRWDKVEALSQWLNVSKSELLEEQTECTEDTAAPAYDEKTQRIINMVASMSDAQKDALLNLFAPGDD